MSVHGRRTLLVWITSNKNIQCPAHWIARHLSRKWDVLPLCIWPLYSNAVSKDIQVGVGVRRRVKMMCNQSVERLLQTQGLCKTDVCSQFDFTNIEETTTWAPNAMQVNRWLTWKYFLVPGWWQGRRNRDWCYICYNCWGNFHRKGGVDVEGMSRPGSQEDRSLQKEDKKGRCAWCWVHFEIGRE